ncbi:hypothetical protein ACIQG8_16410 [Pseudarthrobacter oxydans]|uniref:hypothetical protein n=1 Tax=Pseudarthrobacter oxydans TaxID=1671 RepID=UPI0037F939AE
MLDIVWLKPDGTPMGGPVDWTQGTELALGMYLNGSGIRCSDLTGSQMTDSDFILCFNAGAEPRKFALPPTRYTLRWELVLDTSLEVTATGAIAGGALEVPSHTLLVLGEPGTVVHAEDHNDGPLRL